MQNGTFIIGLTGSLGSGVSTISNILGDKKFHKVSVSDKIKEKFRELHQCEPTLEEYGPDWRAELQDIGNRGRQGEFSDKKSRPEYWIELCLNPFTHDIGGGSLANIVIDGIRNIREVKYLRKTFTDFWLIAVCADFEKRWNRVEKEGKYPNKSIFKRDDERDADEDNPEGQNVEDCVYSADYVLINNEDLTPEARRNKLLWEKLEEQLKAMKEEGDFRGPLPKEVFMATAVSQSHASQCLKRKVGALIVDERNKIPLSVGYNENPIGMESCFSLYHKCYKDMIMESKLEEIRNVYCPECGKKHETLTSPWKCNGRMNGDQKPCRCNFKQKLYPSRNIELCTALHAEERAIRSLYGRSAEGCTIYVNTFPCFQCARYIKDAGIKKVVYVEAYPVKEAVDFFSKNDIKIELFEGFKPRVFNRIFKQID
jgi:dCMP deaminase